MSRISARVRRRRFFAALLVAFLFIIGAVLLTSPETLNSVGTLFGLLGEPAAAEPEPRPDGLKHDLGERLDTALEAAGERGVELYLNSGKRSAERQAELFAEAVTEHGSEEEARRWVLPPEDSAHVSGEAFDVGPYEGRVWLAEHSAEFGLCLVYENEPWHFEVRGDIGDPCPELLVDATGD